jgi:hypothetical protein
LPEGINLCFKALKAVIKVVTNFFKILTNFCTSNVLTSNFLSSPVQQNAQRDTETVPFSPPLSPQMKKYDSREDIFWPSDSPAFTKVKLDIHSKVIGEEQIYNDSPRINRSLIHSFESTAGKSNKETSYESYIVIEEHSELRHDMESEPFNECSDSPTKYMHQNATRSNTQKTTSVVPRINDIPGKYSNQHYFRREPERLVVHVGSASPYLIGERNREEKDTKVHGIHTFDTPSPISPPRSKASMTRGSKLSASMQNKFQSHIPQRMSLRERYSCRERFEDSFSVPSSASTLNSTPRTHGGDETYSIMKSPLDVYDFETDFISPKQTVKSSRRFVA